MEDFIPEGKEQIGAKSLFVDFVPEPTPEQIDAFDQARINRQKAKAKKKEKVVLTEKQIEEFKAMEEETAKEREINGEKPIESEIDAGVEQVEGAEPTTDTPMPNFHKNKNKRVGKRR